jgi:hypothetical protein
MEARGAGTGSRSGCGLGGTVELTAVDGVLAVTGALLWVRGRSLLERRFDVN